MVSINTAELEAQHNEFERLISRTQRKAYNMAFRMTGNRDDAEDLTQEAYLRAYRSFDKYDRNLAFEPWFFRILSNLSIDRLRRKPKTPPLSLDQQFGEENDFTLEIPDEESNPEHSMLRDMVNERMQQALEAMPKDFRKAVLLCDVEGLSYAEIGEVTGAAIGTVRSRIHRGRLMLRKLVNGESVAKSRRRSCARLAA